MVLVSIGLLLPLSAGVFDLAVGARPDRLVLPAVWNTKARGGPREATIPIGGDLAAAVREQQHHVGGRYGATATYLFPARNGAPAGGGPANPAAVGRTLARWARACGMTASDGSPLALTPHRLRHTLATEMLNQGVSQRAIQDHLDHSSPDMTAVYAKLLRRGLLDTLNSSRAIARLSERNRNGAARPFGAVLEGATKHLS